MRDADGIYLGENRCGHWNGVERYQEYECCGGRRVREAVVRCGRKGVIRSAECGRTFCETVCELVPRGV